MRTGSMYLVHPCPALQRLHRRIQRGIGRCGGGVLLPCCASSFEMSRGWLWVYETVLKFLEMFIRVDD